MVVAGLQILNSRMMDVRKTFVVGLSFLIGLSALIPGTYDHVPELLKPVFSSTLSLATIAVILLNLVLRIGIRSSTTFEISPRENTSQKIFEIMRQQGGVWGARPEVITRATSALNEGIEAISILNPDIPSLNVKVSFDELNLDTDISYSGKTLEISKTRPSDSSLLDDEHAMASLSSYMMNRLADSVSTKQKGERAHLLIHFDH